MDRLRNRCSRRMSEGRKRGEETGRRGWKGSWGWVKAKNVINSKKEITVHTYK